MSCVYNNGDNLKIPLNGVDSEVCYSTSMAIFQKSEMSIFTWDP